MLKVKLSEFNYDYWIKSKKDHYGFKSEEKFMKYFFPRELNVKLSIKNNNCILYDIFQKDNSDMDDNKFNIMLCIENCRRWHWYNHYNRYGDFGNPKIHLYIYTHYNKCVFNENFICIPYIYLQITHLNNYYNIIKPSIEVPFENKKFCIFTSSDPVKLGDENKVPIRKFLKSIDDCDDIKSFKHLVGKKSCYHSEELLNLYNQYKFVFVSENSVLNGMITEKIFNGFFSRSIPIYFGAPDVINFFNKQTFINVENPNNLEKYRKTINLLNTNKELYNYIISINKINNSFDDENYINRMKEFIDKIFNN